MIHGEMIPEDFQLWNIEEWDYSTIFEKLSEVYSKKDSIYSTKKFAPTDFDVDDEKVNKIQGSNARNLFYQTYIFLISINFFTLYFRMTIFYISLIQNVN